VHQDMIHYSDKMNLMFFDSKNPNLSKIHNVRRVMAGDGLVWGFPAEYPSGIISLKDFKALLPDGTATPGAIDVINELKAIPDMIENRTRLNSITDFNFKYPPMFHQQLGLEFLFHYPYLVLHMAMGLGKTYVALLHIALQKHLLGRRYKALILGPKITLRNWYEEALKFTDLKPIIYRGTPKQRAALRQRILVEPWDLLITNYEAVVSRGRGDDYKLFRMDHSFDVVFMDEGTRLRGYDSQRSAAVSGITAQAPRRYILTGALSLGKPDDLFQPFRILDPTILGDNFHRFKNKYCTFSPYNKHAVIGYKNFDHLKSRIDPYMLVQHRDKCIDLPPRTFAQTRYEPTAEQIGLYNAIVEQDEVQLGEDTLHVELPVVKITKLLQILSGFLILPYPRNHEKCNNGCDHLIECIKQNFYPWEKDCPRYDPDNKIAKPTERYYEFKKNPKLEQLIEEIEDSGDERLIVWAYYKKEIEHIKKVLDDRKIRYITPATQDSDYVFRDDPGIKVYLGQVSQGIGVTLNDAKVMFFYANSLDLEHRIQALERNYRIGQTEKVLVKDFVCPGSIEPSVLKLLDAKENIKDFFRYGNVCLECDRIDFCGQRAITPFSSECIYADVREDVERKRMLWLKPIHTRYQN